MAAPSYVDEIQRLNKFRFNPCHIAPRCDIQMINLAKALNFRKVSRVIVGAAVILVQSVAGSKP